MWMTLRTMGPVNDATMLEQLLEEINFQRTKEMRQLMKDESGFVVLQGTTYWTDLFVRHFLFQEDQSIDCDDLLFFVRKRHVKGSSRYLPKYEVYASPSRRKMDTKGEGEEMTYPHICFMVDNFDEVFCDIVVRDGEMVCVELVARGRGGAAQAVIFLGSIRYDALTRVYDARQSSLSTKVAQRMSFGLLGARGAGAARCEFVRMRGPGGKGHAEVAVSRPRGSGAPTPSSEPGLTAAELWDSDWEDDPDDMFLYRHQRRLSDPSANIASFVRGGWRSRDRAGEARDKSRSENEGLDSMVDGLAEVEAGDLRDGRRGSGSSRGRGECMRAVAGPPARPAPLSPACLHRRAPAAEPATRVARTPPPLRPLPPPPLPLGAPRGSPRCEIACDVASLDGGDLAAAESRLRPARPSDRARTVRGREELPGELGPRPPSPGRRDGGEAVAEGEGEGGGAGRWSDSARAYVTLPRRRGVAAALFRASRLPPRRTTPDGTDVYYWCDLPKRSVHELDDGAYNPLWALRGFTQTFHLWKEGKRQQSAPLSAFLTYVTLPWWAIAKDILDHREEPILTF
ncbi:caskin-1 isoform X1 [Pieris rapae]|uniref:caskin-1 isoform X1 n=3 Tax=Pieris rapae TaxID=64459 RepID=UPI001E27C5AA|nr:caskin-1 isoform X1 [Pieris rapae]